MAARTAEARAAASDLEIVATRELDAPRELVWAAWTEPAHAARWWGPRGFTSTIDEMDVRPGGAWRFVMHGPDGTDYRNEHRYVEVVRPERLVLDHRSGPRFLMTATFEERGGRTTVTVRMTFPSAEERDRAVREFHADEGLRENVEKLGDYLGAASPGEAPAREVVVTRVLHAPRPLVFEAWARPEHLARWWGPRGFTLPSCELDFRPGGAYRMVMRGPDRGDYPFHGVFREIVPPSRIVFSAVIAPEAGNAVLTTVTFQEEGAGTRVTVRQTVPGDAAAARGQRQGWTESLERLGAHLAGAGRASAEAAHDPAREIVLSRTFDAPRELVFAAWTDPDHLPRWWGPKGFTAATRSIDVRPGGAWRLTMRGPDGAEFPSRVVFEEIVRPERLVLAVDSGEEGDPERFHAIVRFEEVAGGTRIVHRSIFPTAEQRGRVVGLGAIELARSSFERLAEVVAALRAARP